MSLFDKKYYVLINKEGQIAGWDFEHANPRINTPDSETIQHAILWQEYEIENAQIYRDKQFPGYEIIEVYLAIKDNKFSN